MKPVVCVTEKEFLKARAVFETCPEFDCLCAPKEEAPLAEAVSEAKACAVIVGVDAYRDALYQALPRGGVIARFGVGHDGIDKALASRCGVYVTHTPGVLDDSVAEYTLTLMLAVSRRLTAVAEALRAGAWSPVLGAELRGRTVAVIGCGPIGRRVAEIAARGFGLVVTGCEIAPVDQAALCRRHGFSRIVTDFVEAVDGADFVSLHIPALPATRHYLNAERLARLAPESWLINTARGAVVDEIALYDALAARRLGGAALDVFETEPYQPAAQQKDLRQLDNVLLTPHSSSSTIQACVKMAERALRNIALLMKGPADQADLLNPGFGGAEQNG